MSYANLGAAVVLAPADQSRVQSAIALMPRCYTQEFHDCINGSTSNYPNCSELKQLWGPDKGTVSNALDAYIRDNIPYCGANDLIRAPLGYAIIGGALVTGLALGFLLGKK